MERTNYTVLRKSCLSRDVLGIIGSKWTVIVIHLLQVGPMRYSALQRGAEGITQKVLTATLRKLERDGIIERKVYPIIPPRVEYSLTPRGQSLVQTLEALVSWAELHADGVKKSRIAYTRKTST